MKTIIKLLKRVQYGQGRLYPNCDLSHAICVITDKKTLNDDAVTALMKIGKCDFEIETVKDRPKDKKITK